jgi:hypothetical protein
MDGHFGREFTWVLRINDWRNYEGNFGFVQLLYQKDEFIHSMDRRRKVVSKPLKREARLNSIQEFSPYRKENTTLHHYKDQLVNAV